MKSLIALMGIAAASLTAAPADAALLNFSIDGPYTASWTLDSDPRPNFSSRGYTFSLYDVKGGFPGASTSVVDLIFYNQDFEGGFGIIDFYADDTPDDAALLVTTGPQIYSGTEDAPAFRPGVFQLTDFYNPNNYTLTISGVNGAAVPEPATWTMMILGFGMVGAALRRRPTRGTWSRVRPRTLSCGA